LREGWGGIWYDGIGYEFGVLCIIIFSNVHDDFRCTNTSSKILPGQNLNLGFLEKDG